MEQKLFYGHLMKMTTTCSKSSYKAELGAVLTLSKILQSRGATSLSSYLFIQAKFVFVPVDKLVEPG